MFTVFTRKSYPVYVFSLYLEIFVLVPGRITRKQEITGKAIKHRLIKEKNELVTNCNRLKMPAADGKDDNDQVVSSGIYFYQLKTDEFVQSKKMILMK